MEEKFIKVSERSKLPKKPGVYILYEKEKTPLYIGKASNLRERVKNHFTQPNHKDNLFINKIKKIGYIPLKSEIEALIEEAKLIKKYQPKFNVLFRDDKNYFYVGITSEDWPRVFITHQPNLKTYKLKNLKTDFIGPFVGGTALKQTLKILRKIFLFRTCKNLPKKPCLWYQLDRCPAPCLIEKEVQRNPELKKQTKERKKEYNDNIKKLKLVLKEGKERIISRLKKEMQKKAKSQKFEGAAKIRDEIRSLEDVFSHKFLFYSEMETDEENVGKFLKKSLSLPIIPKRIEGYDISNIQGKEMVGSMIAFKLSRICANKDANLCEYKYLSDKNEYRKFKIKTVKNQNDTACLKEIIKRRFSHSEWTLPDLIFVDGGKGQLNAVKEELQQMKDDKRYTITPIISLAKKENILYNSYLKKPLSLDKLPEKIRIIILQLRDESHRFAISYHRKLRTRKYMF